MRIDKKEGQGSRLGLHWETLGEEMGEGGGVYINVLHRGAPT